ncbi:MAG: nuclear transport factor 2 family protein [Cyclobacteriaceae bacterium]|nr:nuclear transport factor 2 family protein [Cyclobacteriaceae bacterium]UYN86348.1 MAG: nuclear transport factor 2 family protein [Cyclobacteriaceae bacterium]
MISKSSAKITVICGIKFFLLFFIAHTSTAQTTRQKEILDLSQRKFVWLINKQLDSLNLILDNDLMYIHSNGWTESKKDVLEDLRSGKLVYGDVQIENAQVRLYKNAAIVTGTGKFSGVNSGNAFDLRLLYTEVYVLKNKKWLLASRHANRLP